MSPHTQQNVDQAEIEKFAVLATRWWDRESEFKPLHEINPLRLEFIDTHSPLNEKYIINVN